MFVYRLWLSACHISQSRPICNRQRCVCCHSTFFVQFPYIILLAPKTRVLQHTFGSRLFHSRSSQTDKEGDDFYITSRFHVQELNAAAKGFLFKKKKRNSSRKSRERSKSRKSKIHYRGPSHRRSKFIFFFFFHFHYRQFVEVLQQWRAPAASSLFILFLWKYIYPVELIVIKTTSVENAIATLPRSWN